MKRFVIGLGLITATLFANTAVDRDQLSETLGHLLVRHLGQSQFELNLEKVVQGIQDEQVGNPAPLTEAEYEKAIFAISEELFEHTAKENLCAAQQFIEKQADDPSICTIEKDRLLYRLDKAGEGECVAENGMPLIHYRGCLLDGSVFASSEESKQPVALPLQHTIQGFSKGLVGMREGEKRTLFIHPDMAYGVAGHLPPNSLLIFEVEIVKANAEATLIASEGESITLPSS